jgi:hypothetical protein
MRFSTTAPALAGAMGLVMLAAAPALACNENDAKLKLSVICGTSGPTWTVGNANPFQMPFAWSDNAGGRGRGWVAGQGATTLPSHATHVDVMAFRPDNGRPWFTHGASGTSHCKPVTPAPTPSRTRTKPPHTPKPTPTRSTPAGQAPPAKPVTKTPTFTG